ncbi:MAG: purine-nucleoside phosphorylase, partial [Mesorhizobium sp.]
MTPHIEASKGDYADTILLPGDPQRAEWMAGTFLDTPRCVNR